MKRNNFLMVVLVCVFLLNGLSAAIPQTLNLQGKLTDSSDNALTGTYNMTFKIYDVVTGGSELWVSANNSVTTDSDGVYNFILAGVNLPFDTEYYLGIKVVNDAEMTPRINLTSSPYTFRTKNISGEGIINDSNVNMVGYNVTVSWFKGLFDWIINTIGPSSNYLSFNGSDLTFSETFLNATIMGEGVRIGFNSTYNATYALYNQTFNATYDSFTLNVSRNWTEMTFDEWGENWYNHTSSVFGTWNSTWDESGWVTANFLSIANSGWNRSGTDVFLGYIGDKVGIGTAAPTHTLNVVGNVNITGNLTVGGLGLGVPANAIMPFNQATCPTGWILADGSSGTPDLRGIFVRGAGTSGTYQMANGTYYTAPFGTSMLDVFQSHYHDWQDGSGNRIVSRQYYGTGSEWAGYLTTSASNYKARTPETAGAAYGTPRVGGETAPASFALIYCMKTTEDSVTSNTIWATSGNDVILNNASKSVKATIILDLLARSNDYTINDTDKNIIPVTTGVDNRTIILPTLADNQGKVFIISKVDDGAGRVIIDGEGAEVIDGVTTIDLDSQYDYAMLIALPNHWNLLDYKDHGSGSASTPSAAYPVWKFERYADGTMVERATVEWSNGPSRYFYPIFAETPTVVKSEPNDGVGRVTGTSTTEFNVVDGSTGVYHQVLVRGRWRA